VRTGDSFRGEGGGLRAVARMLGNVGGARREWVFVGCDGLASVVGGCDVSAPFPGSN
jgi:hypothetical protein